MKESTLKVLPEREAKCKTIAAFVGSTWQGVYETARWVATRRSCSIDFVLGKWERAKNMKWPNEAHRPEFQERANGRY